ASAPPACQPTLSGTPTWKPPTGFPKVACSDAQIAQILADCSGSTYDKTKCDSDQTALAGCYGCMNSTEDAGAPGPLIHTGSSPSVNYPGCLAIEHQDPDAGSCAGTQGVLLDCEILACTAPCTALDGGVPKNFDQCSAAAAATGGPCATQEAA